MNLTILIESNEGEVLICKTLPIDGIKSPVIGSDIQRLIIEAEILKTKKTNKYE